ncbi:MAG: hypothetical protein ACOVRN_17645 [Flavobacterium sp.]
MKRLTLAIAICLCTFKGISQTSATTIEKSIWNVQTGLLGVYVNNEYRLSNAFALRTEVGLDAGFAAKTNDTKWGMIPTINIEPRYYYNLAKRAEKGRNTSGNAANFFTVLFKYNADWFVISSADDVITENMIAVIPKWGISRNIGKSKFNYEAGIGIGYYNYFGSDRKYYTYPENVAVDIHSRIGYRF